MSGEGGGTVRMGRRVVDEVGGFRRGLVELGCWVGGGLERETVFVVVDFVVVGFEVDADAGGFDRPGEEGRPGMIGGGRSRPSAALRESWREKSEACHHSRNLRAKIEVGRRSLRLERRRG